MKRMGWAAFLALFLLAGCEDDGPSHDFGDNDRNLYVAVGDSITSGLEGESDPYPPRLAAMLGRTVVNEGFSGETSGEGEARVSGILAFYKPGYLLILYGANDILFSRPHEGTLAELASMVAKAKAQKTIPVLATLTPMIGNRSHFGGSASALNALIRAFAAEEGVRLADLEDAFAGREEILLMDDNLHPNDAGNQVIAETFRRAL